MEKHAYLIIAHNNFEMLKKLIHTLDDDRNDIYIHIDKKVKNVDFNDISIAAEKSKVMFVNRTKIAWGGYSMVQAELNLLKSATPEHYSYYHLLSGVDMPIKSKDYIYEFFNKHKGTEFIHFSDNEFNEKIKTRYMTYHFLQDYCGSKKNIIRVLEILIVRLQQLLHVNRTKNNNMKFCGGSQWFSITDELACYVLSNEYLIKKNFRFMLIPDEIFLQTIVYNSKYFKNVYDNTFTTDYHSCLRYVDWKRGNPYIFNINDFEELINTDHLFGRKFGYSSKSYSDLVNKLIGTFSN